MKAPAFVAPVTPVVEPEPEEEPAPEPTLADALASVTDPTLNAMLASALAELDALKAGAGTVVDSNIKPPLLFWLSDDRKQGYVASAWKPSAALIGTDDDVGSYRGILKTTAGGTWTDQPVRQGRRWGYWRGKGAPMHAACKLLMVKGWRVIHVASLAEAEARADAELAQAPRVAAPARSKRGNGTTAAATAAPAPLDLTGFEQ